LSVTSDARHFKIERVGVIGAGGAGAMHLHALRRIEGLQVVAIRDIDPERAAALAASFGLPPETAHPDRFYEAKPQSVHIATPPHAHEALAMEALDQSAHVLTEKPPALELAGCHALQEKAAGRMLAIGVNENTAADPLIRKARAMIEAGRLGRLLHIDGFYSFGLRAGQQPPPWMDRLPGGMLEDLLPHLLTTARALTGCRLALRHWHLASTGTIAAQRHDELRLFLAGGSGPTVHLALSLSGQPKAFSLTARGTRAMLKVDLRHMLLQVSWGGSGLSAVVGELVGSAVGMLSQTALNAAGLLTGRREGYGSFLHLVRAHYAALQTGAEVPAPLSRAADVIEIVRKVWPLPDGNGRAAPADAVPARKSE
jgi:predicted dehydrogenase